jgi:hypothetical protein
MRAAIETMESALEGAMKLDDLKRVFSQANLELFPV